VYEVARSGVPRLPKGVLSRPRVQELLDTDVPILVVHAPAGSGKTTAVAHWATTADTPVVWVALNHPGRSRELTWHRIATSVAASGVVGTSVDVDRLIDSPGDLTAGLVALFRSVTELTLVIDGTHLVHDETFFEDLAAVVIHAPGVRLVVVSRTRPALLDPRMSVRVDVGEVPPAALQLQPAETSHLLLRAGLEVSQGLESAVHHAAGGSILAARLIIATASRTDRLPTEDDLSSLVNAGEQYLREFLAQSPARDDLVEFMLLTSAAETLTPALAQRLAPALDAATMIRSIEDVGAGMGGHHDADGSFIYTPLLREGLRNQLRTTRPTDYRRLRVLVAEWESAHGDALLAFEIAAESDDLALATRIAKQTWLDILRFNVAGIIRATTGLKVRRLQGYPILAMLMALAHNTQATGRFKALEYFAVAAIGARIHQRSLSTADRIILATMEGAALRVTGSIDRALPPATKALRLLKEAPESVTAGLHEFLPALLANNGLTLLAHQRYSEALDIFDRAATAATWSSRPRAPFHPLALRAGTAALSGDLPHARTLVDFPHQNVWPVHEQGTYLATFYHVARTVLHLENFDFASASEELDLLTVEMRTNEHRGLLLLLRGLAVGGGGDPMRAAHQMLEAATAEPGLRRVSAPDIAGLHATAAVMFSLAQQHDSARKALDAVPRRWRDRALSASALVSLHQNDPATALRLLDHVPSSEPTRRTRAELNLLQAIAHRQSGRDDLARHHFKAAAVVLTENEMRLPTLLLPAEDLEQLRAAHPDPDLDALLVPGVPTPGSTRAEQPQLSDREKLVINHLAEYLSAPQIAARLVVSVHTVKSQLNSAYRKLGVNNREQALKEAARRGLITTRPDRRPPDPPPP